MATDPDQDQKTTADYDFDDKSKADIALRMKSTHQRVNSMLGPQQVDQLKIAFNLFDKDHNGAIDLSELQTVLKTLGQDISSSECEEMMASVDLDGNGEIDFDEFVTMMENRMFLPSNTTEYKDAFKFFDKNGDGYIDFYELKDVLIALGEEFTDQDVKDMIDEADTSKNGKGKVDFDEFIKMMPNNMQQNYSKHAKDQNFKTIDVSADDQQDNDNNNNTTATATATSITNTNDIDDDNSNSTDLSNTDDDSDLIIPAGKPTKR